MFTNKYVYKTKLNLDDTIKKHKVRYVLRGFEQLLGVHYDFIWASVLKFNSYKILMAFVAVHDLKCEQMNVILTYSHEVLNDFEIFVELPPGIKLPPGVKREDVVGLLNRALYGLKQGARV